MKTKIIFTTILFLGFCLSCNRLDENLSINPSSQNNSKLHSNSSNFYSLTPINEMTAIDEEIANNSLSFMPLKRYY